MMNVPTNVPCQKVLMPSRIRLFRITSISTAPTTAPKAVPMPPGEVGAADHDCRDDGQLDALPRGWS